MSINRSDRINQLATRARRNRRWPETRAALERCLGCKIKGDPRLPDEEHQRLVLEVRPLFQIDANGFWRRSWPSTRCRHCYQFASEWSRRVCSSQAALLICDAAILISPSLVLESAEALLSRNEELALIEIGSGNALELSREEDALVLSICGDEWISLAESIGND